MLTHDHSQSPLPTFMVVVIESSRLQTSVPSLFLTVLLFGLPVLRLPREKMDRVIHFFYFISNLRFFQPWELLSFSAFLRLSCLKYNEFCVEKSGKKQNQYNF